jgi:hypothetical protein
VRFFVLFDFLQSGYLRFCENQTLLQALPSSALSRFLMVSRSWHSQTHRTPAGGIVIPCFLSSLETRTCPQAGPNDVYLSYNLGMALSDTDAVHQAIDWIVWPLLQAAAHAVLAYPRNRRR